MDRLQPPVPRSLYPGHHAPTPGSDRRNGTHFQHTNLVIGANGVPFYTGLSRMSNIISAERRASFPHTRLSLGFSLTNIHGGPHEGSAYQGTKEEAEHLQLSQDSHHPASKL